MYTRIEFFSEYKSLTKKFRDLSFPACLEIDPFTFDRVFYSDRVIKLNTETIYPNHWVNLELQIVIPDLAKCGIAGFYLEQTEQMREIRESRYQCSFCGLQYHKPIQSFCLECLYREDLTEKDLFKLYLLPVSMIGSKVNRKSIYIPEYLKHRFYNHSIPELTREGKIINL